MTAIETRRGPDGRHKAAALMLALGEAHRARLLGLMREDQARDVVAAMAGLDAPGADPVPRGPLAFDDLARLDPAAVRVVLRGTGPGQLPLALKGASEALREALLGALPDRAARALRAEVEALGPVRLRDVDAAQAAMLALARRPPARDGQEGA